MRDNGNMSEPLVLESTQDHATVVHNGVSPTLVASMGTGGGYIPMVTDKTTAYTQSSYAACPSGVGTLRAKSGDYGGGSETLVTDTVYEAYQHHGYRESEVFGTLTADQNTSIRGVSPLIECQKVLRRLTPEECELLQGFPKGWTNIGEWTDTKGKLHKESSDTARYKALGNSIALPYWKVLARKIAAQYDRDITIGSLFDGIGGFPLAFEHCGAKAVWASEIEEFPIAVTKKHFPDESEVITVDPAAKTAT